MVTSVSRMEDHSYTYTLSSFEEELVIQEPPALEPDSTTTDVRVSWVTSKRGGRQLVLDGKYLHRANGSSKELTYWKCIRPQCNANVHLYKSSEEIKKEDSHEHDAEDIAIGSRVFKSNLKMYAAEHPYARPKDIYTAVTADMVLNEFKDHSQESRAEIVSTFKGNRPTIQRVHRKQVPQAPSSTSDINLSMDYISYKTPYGSNNFLLCDEYVEGKRMIAFGTAAFIKLLTTGKVFGDGTFKQCPSNFYQLYTIHGYKVVDSNTKQLLPCVYAFMPDNRAATYERLLRSIKGKIQLIHSINWTPEQFQIDFEQSMITAINEVFGTGKVKGCLFHFAQAIRRKAIALHLGSYLDELDHPVKDFVRGCRALPLMRQECVEEAFEDLCQSVPDNQDYNDQVIQFINYMKTTWIGGFVDNVQKRPLFHKSMWCQYREFQDRTNNKLEGFHHDLNKNKATHPNVYEFITRLIATQVINDQLVESLDQGHPVQHEYRLLYQKINDRIQTYTNRLDQALITKVEFLKRCASMLQSTIM